MSYEEYRALQIEISRIFQDVVADALSSELGLSITVYGSRLFQQISGETRQGIEIKYDKGRTESGNLFIEIGEKARPRNGDFAKSGILRDDNSWLYVIGDLDVLYVFAKSMLIGLHNSTSKQYRTVRNGSATSNGYLLPESDAARYSANILTPSPADNIRKTLTEMNERAAKLYAEIIKRRKGKQ